MLRRSPISVSSKPSHNDAAAAGNRSPAGTAIGPAPRGVSRELNTSHLFCDGKVTSVEFTAIATRGGKGRERRSQIRVSSCARAAGAV
jgi:hypothetical protein